MSIKDVKLVYYPNPILRMESRLIQKSELNDIKKLVKKMYKIMKDNHGIGLSAIQVGIPIQLFLCEEKFFINPLIISKSNDIIEKVEGCLSIPGKNISVPRSEEIVIEYVDRKWVQKRKKLKGLEAIVCQHEIDHLNGKLIIDYEMDTIGT